VLERLRDQGRPNLTRVALEVGFSSHSHLTSACRQFLGVPPSHLARWHRVRASS
jgi:AraC-like DNA-binding protein